MVYQIPVPQAKYKLLDNIHQSHWKSPFVCLTLVFIIVGGVLILHAWLDLVSSGNLESGSLSSIIITSEDATIVAWARRARMYAESTKENQNADRNTTIITPESVSNASSSKIIVCYFSIPGALNTSEELEPAHIDPDICTHIIVGFASVVNCSLSLGSDPEVYRKVVNLKKLQPKLKVMISAAGINELNYGFPEMVKTHANRKQFIRSVLNITKVFNFDGLDIDWEFPAWLGGNEREKIYFIQLLQELKKEFNRSGRNLILSAAVGAPSAIIDGSYNIPEIAEHVDFINLMAYDYHYYVWYLPVTGINAPLYPRRQESGYIGTMNVNYSAMYWVSKGMPKEKIVVGIPTYGHSFQLDNALNNGIMAPVKGFGRLGEAGFVRYSTICKFIRMSAKKVFDEDSRTPYTYKHDEWISFDDHVSILEKAEWIKANGFKGAMIFSLNTDDWKGGCNENGNITFPLTRVASNTLLESRTKEIPPGA